MTDNLPASSARRQLLRRATALGASAAGLPGVGCTPSPPAPGMPGLAERFIVHGETNWEPRPTTFGDEPITPHDKLYVCNHLPFPDPAILSDRSSWRLDVRGTRKPLSLTLGELRALGISSETTVLQCAGNGRKFAEHQFGGPIWGIGAVGCVTWTGVPLGQVVAAAGGVNESARYATATGGEPVNPLLDALFSMRVERSIPIAKALQDCLLAYNMNDAPIPLVHGGPLRLIVPGYFGINQVKYLKTLAFTEEQSEADVMQSEYRFRPIGEPSAPTQPTAWAMDTKSIIWPVAQRTIRRDSLLHGVAFGGVEPIARVEVSWNDGADWHVVPFSGPNLGRYAWRRFSIRVDVPRGTRRVASRAIDVTGRRQLEWSAPNAGAYGNTSGAITPSNLKSFESAGTRGASGRPTRGPAVRRVPRCRCGTGHLPFSPRAAALGTQPHRLSGYGTCRSTRRHSRACGPTATG